MSIEKVNERIRVMIDLSRQFVIDNDKIKSTYYNGERNESKVRHSRYAFWAREYSKLRKSPLFLNT